jgi:hypothetical protein
MSNVITIDDVTMLHRLHSDSDIPQAAWPRESEHANHSSSIPV